MRRYVVMKYEMECEQVTQEESEYAKRASNRRVFYLPLYQTIPHAEPYAKTLHKFTSICAHHCKVHFQ